MPHLLAASRTLNRDRGASAVEYGLLVAALAAIVVAAVFAYTNATSGIFFSSCNAFGGVDEQLDCAPAEGPSD